ncbi:hypothetical protein MAPG_11556 [Magnaporthiopsis poae ATCC 64411]|uniref:Fructose-bisphosphate aldolase n=1 Tax=Magnaporthiopsis poae (strain ATCC 64411 / 73-15) TaxID=644358 RepID=A0A0C4EFK5_MAGP6|nr:hypothetical protein MAPG_11556 [Magnaporthiopsis poae ATCC 64411]
MAVWNPTTNKTYQILKAAEEGGYGVQAPIAYNLEHVVAFVAAAEAKRSPLIIQVFPWAVTFSDGLIVHAAANAAKQATVPIARGPVLDWDRLESIRRAAAGRVRLVLHGTNGFPENVMRRSIAGGVSKVNVNKLVLDDYLVHLRQNASKLSLTELMEQGVKEARRLMEWQMDVVGSTGRAP